jgi:hypothetical protein
MSKVPLYVHGGAERMRGGARQLALCSTSRGSVSATETKRERERERQTDIEIGSRGARNTQDRRLSGCWTCVCMRECVCV